MKCNGDCFNCQYTDCIADEEDIVLTEQEKATASKRDSFVNVYFRCDYSTYEQTTQGKKRRIKYNNTPKGKELFAKYNASDKGQERLRKYNNSEKGKERLKRYAQSEKGRLNQIRKNERRKEQRRLAHGNLQTNC